MESNRKKTTFNLNGELHQRLKIEAATQRRDMVDILEEIIAAYLEQRSKEHPYKEAI